MQLTCFIIAPFQKQCVLSSLQTETDQHKHHDKFRNNNRHYFYIHSVSSETEESNEEHRKHKASFVRSSQIRSRTQKILWTTRRWSHVKIHNNQSGFGLKLFVCVNSRITDWGRPWWWRGGENESMWPLGPSQILKFNTKYWDVQLPQCRTECLSCFLIKKNYIYLSKQNWRLNDFYFVIFTMF